MKKILVFLLIVIAAFACIPLIPLDTAVSLAKLDKLGFSAGGIDGNLSSGRMFDAKISSVPLGDVMTSMSFADLAKGRVRLLATGSDPTTQLNGGFSYGIGGLGLEDFSMGLPTMAAGPGLMITLSIKDVNVRFPGGMCTNGTGTARGYIGGQPAELGIPDSISGPVVCRDGHMVLDLASDSGREREEITILDPKQFRVRITVQQSIPQIVDRLKAKGFISQPEGYVYEDERTL